MKKADANDVIIFETKKDDSINDSFEVKTTKAITVEFDGIFKKTITIDMPNGDVNNYLKFLIYLHHSLYTHL